MPTLFPNATEATLDTHQRLRGENAVTGGHRGWGASQRTGEGGVEDGGRRREFLTTIVRFAQSSWWRWLFQEARGIGTEVVAT